MAVTIEDIDLPEPATVIKLNGRMIDIETLVSLTNFALDELEQRGVIIDFTDNLEEDNGEIMYFDGNGNCH